MTRPSLLTQELAERGARFERLLAERNAHRDKVNRMFDECAARGRATHLGKGE